MQAPDAWTTDFVRAGIGQYVTKYQVLRQVTSTATQAWLEKKRLCVPLEELVQRLSDSEVTQIYEDYHYEYKAEGKPRPKATKNRSQASSSSSNMKEKNDNITLKGRTFTTPALLSPELAEHVAEPTVLIRSNTTSVMGTDTQPNVDAYMMSAKFAEADEAKVQDETAADTPRRRSRKVLGRIRKSFLRMVRGRPSPTPLQSTTTTNPDANPRLESLSQVQNQPVLFSNLQLLSPKRPSLHSPSHAEAQVFKQTNLAGQAFANAMLREPFGHTVYTEVFISSWSQKGTDKAQNEDRLFATNDLWRFNNDPTISQPHTALVGVFDGHGGSFAAELCAREFPKAVYKSSFFDNLDMDISPILASALEEAVHTVESSLRTAFSLHGESSGACAAIVAFRGGRLCVCNVGDCQTWLYDEEGGIHCMCAVHRTSAPSEIARLEEAGVPIRGGRVYGVLEPTRTLGDFDVKRRNPSAVLSKPYIANTVLKKNKRWTLPHTEHDSHKHNTERHSNPYITTSNHVNQGMSTPASEETVSTRSINAFEASTCAAVPGQPHVAEEQYSRSQRLAEVNPQSGIKRLFSMSGTNLKRNHSTSMLRGMMLGSNENKGSKKPGVGLGPSKHIPFLVTASDGVWDTLSPPEAMLIVRDALMSEVGADSAARVLAQRALKAGSEDDISVVVMQFTN